MKQGDMPDAEGNCLSHNKVMDKDIQGNWVVGVRAYSKMAADHRVKQAARM